MSAGLPPIPDGVALSAVTAHGEGDTIQFKAEIQTPSGDVYEVTYEPGEATDLDTATQLIRSKTDQLYRLAKLTNLGEEEGATALALQGEKLDEVQVQLGEKEIFVNYPQYLHQRIADLENSDDASADKEIQILKQKLQTLEKVMGTAQRILQSLPPAPQKPQEPSPLQGRLLVTRKPAVNEGV